MDYGPPLGVCRECGKYGAGLWVSGYVGLRGLLTRLPVVWRWIEPNGPSRGPLCTSCAGWQETLSYGGYPHV
jgi:hypothetical protein